jgi:hypothetical protein
MGFDPELAQILRDNAGSAVLGKGKLRMRVQVAADAGELGVVGADALDGGGHIGRSRRRGSTA